MSHKTSYRFYRVKGILPPGNPGNKSTYAHHLDLGIVAHGILDAIGIAGSQYPGMRVDSVNSTDVVHYFPGINNESAR